MDLSSLSNKLLPGLTTLGFKDDRRHKGTFVRCPGGRPVTPSHLLLSLTAQ